MKKILAIIVCCLPFITAFTQVKTDALFTTTVPLDIGFSISIKTIKKSKADSVYFEEKLYYRNEAGGNDSVKIGLKRRGNFRLQQCFFPPLWIKINKKNGKNTLFEGNKKLKLVMPCNRNSESNDLILHEYLCYKLYEAITFYCFKSRLVNIDFTDEKGKKNQDYQLKGILIEDVDKTAKRCGGKAASTAKINAKALNDTCALRFDLFQLLIANTDWSKGFQHNSKLIYHHSKYIPLPYDFDMSGVVDAPYSVVSQVGAEQLPIENVRERYYRGFCASNETTQFVRNEFLLNEEKLLAVPDELKGSLSDKEIKNLKSYLEEFFEILKDDDQFGEQILSRCRPK
jgi:hypothetical protein